MDRYIDADKLLKMIEQEKVSPPPRKNSKSNSLYLMGLFEAERTFRTCLFLAECEDVAPVIHAHWVKLHGDYSHPFSCSNCSSCSTDSTDYCKDCGARMDEEVNDG